MVLADPSADSVTAIVDELTGGIGADLAIECAGVESALKLCIEAVRPAGTVVQTALHIRPASIRAETLALKDLTLAGTWCYPIQDFPRVAGPGGVRAAARGAGDQLGDPAGIRRRRTASND